MKTLTFNASQALRLHESGGYASLRCDEPVAAVVEYDPEMPPWVTFISPYAKIFGMRFRVSDVHAAKEGAVSRDINMQRHVQNLFSSSAIYDLAPPTVVEACSLNPSESVHADLLGYYHFSPVITESVKQTEYLIQRAEAWLQDFPREAMADMTDTFLESAGWLSLRSESQRTYAQLLFATPSVARGMRGASVDQIIDALEKALRMGVSLDSLRLDPRFLRVPKFSLGLKSIAVASKRVQLQLIHIAELRSRLVERLDSPLLFDDVAAERLRMDDEYRDLLATDEDADTCIRASLDAYAARWAAVLYKAVIV